MKVNVLNSIPGLYGFKLAELHWGGVCGVSAFIKAKLKIQAESIIISNHSN